MGWDGRLALFRAFGMYTRRLGCGVVECFTCRSMALLEPTMYAILGNEISNMIKRLLDVVAASAVLSVVRWLRRGCTGPTPRLR